MRSTLSTASSPTRTPPGSADSGFYVGQCRDCDILVTDNVAERNAVGFENANASDSLVIVGNRFAGNRVGLTLLSSYQEAFLPQQVNQVVGNLISDNDAGRLPRPSRRRVRHRYWDRRWPVQHRGTEPDLRPRPGGRGPHQRRGHSRRRQQFPRQRAGRKRRRRSEPIGRADSGDGQLRHRCRNDLAHDAAGGIVVGVRWCGRAAAGVGGHRRRSGRTPGKSFKKVTPPIDQPNLAVADPAAPTPTVAGHHQDARPDDDHRPGRRPVAGEFGHPVTGRRRTARFARLLGSAARPRPAARRAAQPTPPYPNR